MMPKFKGITPTIVTLLLLVFTLFVNPTIGDGFDLTYPDPQGDVIDSSSGLSKPSGYEYIDILQITSTGLETILGTQIILQMKVQGVITDSEEITYVFQIMDGDVDLYYIMYQNGDCTGVNMEDGSMDDLLATGSGTDTLETSVQLSDIGDISDFDFSGTTLHNMEADSKFFVDLAGNVIISDNLLGSSEMPVTIVEPKFKATVSGTKKVVGTTKNDYDMTSVEIQMDSKSNDGWILTSSSDNWENWTFDLDTTSFTDGKHILHARAYNGTEYFFDSVEIFLNQGNAESPRTTNLPKISVGDRFEYKIEVDIPDLGGSISFESQGTMNYTVEDIKDIVVEGKIYETFIIKVESSQISKTNDIETTMISEGYDWIRTSDLAIVKSQVKSTSYIPDGDETRVSVSNISMIYQPPLDKYNFPIKIGRSWTSPGNIKYSYGSGSETLDETYLGPFEFEALHIEQVTVPAGSFETFVLWSQELYSREKTIACNLDYYSPKLGFQVKSESYDSQRNLYYTMELVSYEKVAVDGESEGGGLFGENDSNLPYILILLIIIILVSVLIGYKRRASKREVAQSPLSESGETGEDQIPGYSNRPQVRPLKSVATLQENGVLKDSSSSVKFVKCLKCSRLISPEKGVLDVKCPYCGTVQMVQ
jgi:hypothetical protein